MHRSLTAVFFLTALFSVAAELPPRPTPSIRQVEGSPLAYTPDGAGNTVIDFSHAGYAGGGEAIPFVSAKFTVAPSSLSAPNDRARIQAALDAVATLPVGPDGFRGAVLLAPGRYTIDGTLRLNASGVVLRGSRQGANENDPTATVLVSTPPVPRILSTPSSANPSNSTSPPIARPTPSLGSTQQPPNFAQSLRRSPVEKASPSLRPPVAPPTPNGRGSLG